MKVILLQNIKGVGRTGDVKDVADGYGRNYLFPHNLAKPAHEGALKEVEALKKKAESRERVKVEMAGKIAETLKDANLEFTKKASEGGTLFASVTKTEVAEALSKLAGYTLTEEMVDFGPHGEHIKLAGEHMIDVELAKDTKIQVKVTVKSEE